MGQYIVICGDGLTPDPERRGRSVIASKHRPKDSYSEKEEARAEAHRLAAQHPQVPIYIFDAAEVIETKAPEFQRKMFNERGELIPEGF